MENHQWKIIHARVTHIDVGSFNALHSRKQASNISISSISISILQDCIAISLLRVAAGQGQGPQVRAGMSLEGRVRAQMSGPQVRAGLNLEARP